MIKESVFAIVTAFSMWAGLYVGSEGDEMNKFLFFLFSLFLLGYGIAKYIN